jgi:amidohydrolase
MSDVEKLKTVIREEMESQREKLKDLALKIHSTPEVGFKEFKAAEWITDYLRENGFTIEPGLCDLPTAFQAIYGNGKPYIAVLAEYDALPELGHACGHNLIATIAVGAAVAAKKAIDRFGGRVLVIGTPGEEGYGGKVTMAQKGAFDNLDAALIVHPEVCDVATIKALACVNLHVEFFGRASHAAALPEAGINALEAMVQSFVSINSLRQHIRDSSRIHGIITDGGKAANVVPEYSAGNFIVRATEDSYLDELMERVLYCFIGAATTTGTRLEYKWGDTRYATVRSNIALAEAFRLNMESLGRNISLANPSGTMASTDFGNVSHLVPGLHACVAVATPNVLIHSADFARATRSERAIKGVIDAAKAVAMTIADLVASPKLMEEVRDEFKLNDNFRKK